MEGSAKTNNEKLGSWDAQTILMRNEPITLKQALECVDVQSFMVANRLVKNDMNYLNCFSKLSQAEKDELSLSLVSKLDHVIERAESEDLPFFNTKKQMMEIVGMAMQSGKLDSAEALKVMTKIQESKLK